MRYVKNYVYLYVYILNAEAMVEMKKYIKPEIEIVEFEFEDIVNVSGDPGLDLNSDEVFYGIEAGEEGYLVNNY